MARKTFCNGCGAEIERDFAGDRYKPVKRIGNYIFKAEVMLSEDGTWNKADICWPCLHELLMVGPEGEAP